MGKLDNTLIIYIVGDNGTSPEGTLLGTPNQWTAYNGILDFPIAEQLKFYDAWGSAATYPHMAVAVVVGVRHAVQVHQADRLALRRHAAGHGDLVARPHQGRRRHPQPVPPHHRHRADDPRSHRASRRRRLVDGIKQKPIEGVSMAYTFDKANAERAVDAQDPVLRDDRQPRHLSRRLVRQHDAAARAVDPECAAARADRLQVGALQPDRGLLAGQRPRREDARQAQGDAGALGRRRRRSTTCCRSTTASFARAVEPRPSATAGQTEFTYTGVNPGIPIAQRAEHPRQVLHDHRRGRGARRAAATA